MDEKQLLEKNLINAVNRIKPEHEINKLLEKLIRLHVPIEQIKDKVRKCVKANTNEFSLGNDGKSSFQKLTHCRRRQANCI